MNYDFDAIIDRRGTNSLKYDFARERRKAELQVAESDITTLLNQSLALFRQQPVQ